MSNPWLGIPLADYEGHMKSAEVQQLDALAELFAEALTYCHPSSIAVLGLAGGNGLDRVDAGITKRATRRGFILNYQVQRSLPGGKGLWMGIFSQ